MKTAFFLVSFLLILSILAIVFSFVYDSFYSVISFVVAGILLFLLFIFLVTSSKKDRVLTEDDLEDGRIYGVVGNKYQQGEPVLLEDIINEKAVGIFQLTYIPRSVFRGWEAKNFSKLKKAIE